MKKIVLLALAVGLAASTTQAQTVPSERHHTRPPYSGPRKNKDRRKPRPQNAHTAHTASADHGKPKASHIQVR